MNEELTFDKWIEKFKPYGHWNGNIYSVHTYSADCLTTCFEEDYHFIWTIISYDDEKTHYFIGNGFRSTNKIYRLITNVAWEKDYTFEISETDIKTMILI